MPIEGLSTDELSFPRIGKLRKGEAKKDDRPGKDLTYFRFTSEDPALVDRFREIYGPEPREIHVILPFRTKAENWSDWKEAWKAGGMLHRCTGTRTVIFRQKDGSYCDDPKKQIACPGGCKEVGRLSIIIPEFARLAFVTVETHSKLDIIEINRNLNMLQFLYDDLRKVPMVLRREKRMVSCPIEGRRVRQEKWLLHIEADPEWVARRLAADRAAVMPQLPETIDGEIVVDSINGDNGIDVDPETGEILDTSPGKADSTPIQAAPPHDDYIGQPPPDAGPVEDRPAKQTDALTAEDRRRVIRMKAGWKGTARLLAGDPATEKQIGYAASLLTDRGAKTSEQRRWVLTYLFNCQAGANQQIDLYKREASQLIDWLTSLDEKLGKAEVGCILREQQKANGQAPLFE